MTLDDKINEAEKSIKDKFISQINTVKDLQNDFYITAGILVCIGIDTLTGYYNGKNSTGKFFVDFVESYMDSNYKDEINGWQNKSTKRNYKYSEILYKNFRCGLVHSLSFMRRACFSPGINPKTGKEYQYIWYDTWDKTGLITLFISLPKFIKDFESACDKYFTSLRDSSNKCIRDNFEKRFDDLWIT